MLECYNHHIYYGRDFLNVSLRWLDVGGGFKFDDWHDGKHEFQENRTTYADYRGHYNPLEGGSREYATRAGTKESLLKELARPFPNWVTSTAPGLQSGLFGYEEVIEFLSRFNSGIKQTVAEIKCLTPEKGLTYLLDEVLPAIEIFVRS